MTGQSVVILVIILGISLFCFKMKQKKWAYSSLPLLLLPAANITARQIAAHMFVGDFRFWMVLTTLVTASLISCVWAGICSVSQLNGKRYQIPYLVVIVLFNVILCILFTQSNYEFFI